MEKWPLIRSKILTVNVVLENCRDCSHFLHKIQEQLIAYFSRKANFKRRILAKMLNKFFLPYNGVEFCVFILKHENFRFHQLQTLIVKVNILRHLQLIFLYMEKNYSMASVVFFQTHFVNLEFVHFVACPLNFLTLKRYISKHNGWNVLIVLKIWMARLQMTTSQIFSVRKFFTQKLLAKI